MIIAAGGCVERRRAVAKKHARKYSNDFSASSGQHQQIDRHRKRSVADTDAGQSREKRD